MVRRKKPSGRQPRSDRSSVHDRPYWFDRSRSLCELHGWPRSDPNAGAGLVGRYTAAVNRPVGGLDVDAIALLLSQGTDPHFIVPVALDLARAGDPDLLRCLVAIGPPFWRTHPYLRAELVALARTRVVADPDLAAALAAFVAAAP